MLLAQPLLQRAEVFFALVLRPGARIRHLLLKFLRLELKCWPTASAISSDNPCAFCCDGLQLLCHLLPESFQRLD